MKINITRKRIRTSRIILSTIGVIAIAIGVFSYLQPTSRAANLSNFDPSNIMSDYVMGNKDSMTEAQIQTFLESKNACNNTNISKASVYHKVKDGRFVCMYEDTFDGETAAHIIWQAGQDYSINPRVIIVLLQKEQGLITDTWPNSIQYNKATGYGCPDTAACDTQYYGLKNQIRQAANLFRNVLNGGWSNYPVGNNYVQYHPNAACGGTTVNIKNRATSALYRYTPYQPNQAALNAGYGTGDSCSAYGNRNFWLYFTDWFGDTQGQRWTPLQDPRVLITPKDVHKINPDSHEQTQLVPAGSQIAFPTKTTLSDGGGCLRTQHDTINNRDQCIKYDDLDEFTPTISSIIADNSIAVKETTQWTCKVNYRTLEITNQCFNTHTQINFLKKTTIAGVDYLITKVDSDNENMTAFVANRFVDAPSITTLSPSEKLRTSTEWTCKINLSSNQVIPSQCYNKNSIISFSKLVTVNNTQYLVTDHDDARSIDSAFLAKRFTLAE